MDISAVVLSKLLTEKNLDVYSKLKLVFLDPAYASLYAVIGKHYEKYGALPTFDDLELTLREGQTAKTLATLKLLELPDVDLNIAFDALVDQYTQTEVIKELDKFADKLPMYDSREIIENLSSIVLSIEEKTLTSENVFTMQDIMLFQQPEDLAKDRVYSGLNNTFDAVLGGFAREEVIFIGGIRGSGKSLVCSNLFINQYEVGNVSQYFTIEMKAYEVHQRNMSILAGVNHQNLKQDKLSPDETLRVIKAQAGMYENAEQVVSEFLEHRDKFKFEQDLVRNYKLKPNNQLIIVDDRNLTISSIDLHIGKAKAKFGDSLKMVIIDYINQIVIEGAGQYDWQPQIEISKKLKNLARKHGIVIVSPYQIDAAGEARFAKGILDAADIALVLNAHDKEANAISFETTKIRGARDMSFTSPIDWDSLRISPQSIDKPGKKEKSSKKPTKAQTTEEPCDLPWADT